MKTIKDLKTEFQNTDKIPMFEIPVIDNRTNEEDYIIFDISIHKDTLRAEHVGLTEEEENSDFVAFKDVDLDDCFSLDYHLQELYSICTEAICNSDFYSLP